MPDDAIEKALRQLADLVTVCQHLSEDLVELRRRELIVQQRLDAGVTGIGEAIRMIQTHTKRTQKKEPS